MRETRRIFARDGLKDASADQRREVQTPPVPVVIGIERGTGTAISDLLEKSHPR